MERSIPLYNILPIYRAFDLKMDKYLTETFYIGNTGKPQQTYIDFNHFLDDMDISSCNEKICFERSVGIKDHTPWGKLSEEKRENWLNSQHASEAWPGHELFIGDIIKYKCYYTNEYGSRVQSMIAREVKDDIRTLFQLQSICELNDTLVRIGNIHTRPEFMESVGINNEKNNI